METQDGMSFDDPKIRDEIVRGVHQIVVLALLRKGQYGYQLAKILKQHGVSIQSGTLYPMLRRLESKGLLESSWDTLGSHPRKVYVTTEAGHAVLKELRPLGLRFYQLTQMALKEAEGDEM